MLKTKVPEKRIRYPHSIRGVYASVVLAGISIVFSVLLIADQTLLLLDFTLFTILITLIAFAIKIRIFSARSETEADSSAYGDEKTPWRNLILLFALIFAAIFVPIFLASILDYLIWFTLLAGFVSGLSLSEILLYLYTRREKGGQNSSGVEQNNA